MKHFGKAAILVGLVAGLTLTACEFGQNAPTTTRDTSGARVLNFPNEFANVSAKCDGANMVYVVAGGKAAVTVVPDERCIGKE